MATSTVPAVLDAMVTLFAAGLTEVDVSDGPAVVDNYPDKLAVGYSGRENSEVVTGDQNAAGIQRGNHPRDEVYFVSCLINSTGGDVMSTRRARAFEILANVEAVLRADSSLGGAVGSSGTAQVADFALLQDLSEPGMFAGLLFRVRVKARI